ncbi:hypothetical protein [Nostoc sp. TCL26-01]|nr:hypothetical protein [Nostoc sp. TCL26-01]
MLDLTESYFHKITCFNQLTDVLVHNQHMGEMAIAQDKPELLIG